MRNAIRLCLAGVVLLGSATSMILSPAAAHAASRGPDAQAWWYIGNQGLVSAPPPPGIGARDLFVEGARGNLGPPPVAPPFGSGAGQQGVAHAIAALRYTIPAGASVDRLKLRFAGSAPSSVSVQACRTGDFKAEQGGPFADVPPYDCTVPSIGSFSQDATGKTDGILFTDISGLVKGSTLSFVIVPDAYDYEDLAAPGADSLTFRDAPPNFAAGGDSVAQPSSSFDTGPAVPVGDGTAAGGAAGPVGAISSGTFPGLADPGSVVAPAATPTGATATAPGARPAARPAAVAPRLPINDRDARIAAGVGLALSVLAFALLMAMESPRLRRLLGLRISDAGATSGARGLGRFAQLREGHPTSLR